MSGSKTAPAATQPATEKPDTQWITPKMVVVPMADSELTIFGIGTDAATGS